MRASIIFPAMTNDPQDLVPFARLVDEGRAQRLWQGQSLTLETHQLFAYLAGTGLRVPVGTSVVLMPMRHPLEAAVQARSLAQLTGHGTVLGLGPGTPDFVEGLHGEPYPSPREACVDYLAEVRRLLPAGDRGAGGVGPPDAVTLPGMPHPGVELGLGVLRPVLARAAGRVADAAISWMTPPDYVADVLLRALAEGAAEAGRAVPRLVTVVHAALARPGRNPYRLAYAGASRHLAAPHYTDMLRRAGLRVHPAQPNLGARALVDSGTFLYGSPAEVARGLAEYDRAGVDEVVLNLCGVGTEHGWPAAAQDLREILTAFHGD